MMVQKLFRATDALPLRDGEIVIADEQGWTDFGGVQSRLSKARRLTTQAAGHSPAVLVVFDLLKLARRQLAEQPRTERRRQLAGLLDALHGSFHLITQTADVELAATA